MQIFNKYNFLILILVSTFSISSFSQNTKFKVVLDAGHGGKDIGATHHGYAEKKIALNVTLKIGKLLAKHSNIEVIYTRDTDVFIELNERANIANSNKASIFVSIHCNANDNYLAEGYETFVMGVHRNASNLEVARKENQVVTMEKDYKVKYNGYDPKNPESAIGMTLMQEEFMDKSISLAIRVQNGMATNFPRKDRRVKQAGFLVLRDIYMPRILVELGFISNKREGEFLNSEEGQVELATGIANAIISYKKEYFGSGENEPAIEKYVPKTEEKERIAEKQEELKIATPKTEAKSAETGVIFKVQIAASGKNLELIPGNFKGLNNLSSTTDNGTLYKYMYGNTSSYTDAKKNLEEAKIKGFEGAYIVAFKDGKKISLQDALK
jgi:N-acetylmuramoyl-L-alanine amidase